MEVLNYFSDSIETPNAKREGPIIVQTMLRAEIGDYLAEWLCGEIAKEEVGDIGF